MCLEGKMTGTKTITSVRAWLPTANKFWYAEIKTDFDEDAFIQGEDSGGAKNRYPKRIFWIEIRCCLQFTRPCSNYGSWRDISDHNNRQDLPQPVCILRAETDWALRKSLSGPHMDEFKEICSREQKHRRRAMKTIRIFHMKKGFKWNYAVSSGDYGRGGRVLPGSGLSSGVNQHPGIAIWDISPITTSQSDDIRPDVLQQWYHCQGNLNDSTALGNKKGGLEDGRCTWRRACSSEPCSKGDGKASILMNALICSWLYGTADGVTIPWWYTQAAVMDGIWTERLWQRSGCESDAVPLISAFYWWWKRREKRSSRPNQSLLKESAEYLVEEPL